MRRTRYPRIEALFFCLVVACSGDTDDKSANADTSDAAGSDVQSDVGGSDSGALSCEDAAQMLRDELGTRTADCTADAECHTQYFLACTCPTTYRGEQDPELDRLANIANQCDLGCNSEPFCAFDDFGSANGYAACVAGTCQRVPAPSCDLLATGMPVEPNFCEGDEDCAVRTDIDLCGCPQAWHVTSGEILARAVADQNCEVPDVCATIDCSAQTEARCDNGVCVLSP